MGVGNLLDDREPETGAVGVGRTPRTVLGYIDDLYERIRTHGYERQTTLSPAKSFAGRTIHPSLNEVQVCVGPTGRLLVKSGYHRYTIAKLLELETIPVRTQIPHENWQRIREAIHREDGLGRSDPELSRHLDHPELAALVRHDGPRRTL